MPRKAIYALSALMLTIAIGACSSDDGDTSLPQPTAEGTFTDPRDGQTYSWVRYGSLDWMTQNFSYDTGDATACTVYIDGDEYQSGNTSDTKNLGAYGRLYTHAAAANSAPEGWRLPTDAEWTLLEQQTNGQAREAISLKYGGYYTLNTIMGTSGWRFRGIYGFYWAADADDSKTGEYYFYRKTTYNADEMVRQSQEPSNQLSVRYVRESVQ